MRWKPKEWILIGLLFAAMSIAAAAQPATTQVSDTIYHADGTVATGTVLISWPAFTTSTGQTITSGSTSAVIAPDGALSVQLTPNAGSVPMGSYYTVIYHLDDGSVSRQYWVVPASSTPVKISGIESTVLPASVAMQTVSKSYVDSAIAAALTGSPLDASPYVLKAGDTMTGPLDLPGDPVSPTQAADKNYVDESIGSAQTGLDQKVSTVPSTTQTVAQPVGTELAVNNLNDVEYASQYNAGFGGNGIANAIGSASCTGGCDVTVEHNYPTTEPYFATTLSDNTHVKDLRNGHEVDSYKNPLDIVGRSGLVAQKIDEVSTLSAASIFQQTPTQSPASIGLTVSQEAYTGGSNQFPGFESSPYFKMGFSAMTVNGTYNTQGEHVLTPHEIDCFGVGDCLLGSRFIYASGGMRDEADEGAHLYDTLVSEDTRVFAGTCSSGCSAGSTSVAISATAGGSTQGDGRYLIDMNPAKTITSTSTGGLIAGGSSGPTHPAALFTGTNFPLSVFLSVPAIIPSQANNIAPGTVTFAIATSGVPSGFGVNTSAIGSSSGLACIADVNGEENYEMAPFTVVDATHLQMTFNKAHRAGATLAFGGLCGYGIEQTADTQNGIRQLFPVIGAYSPTALYYAGGAVAVIGETGATSAFLNTTSAITNVSRSGNLVSATILGSFPHDINGLTVAISGIADASFNGTYTITTTGPSSFTYAQTGPDASSTGGGLSFNNGKFVLYPMAEVVSVYNASTAAVDGTLTLAPNNVAWSPNDPVEEPHYFQEYISADIDRFSQTVPRPTFPTEGGIQYLGNNSALLTGWSIENTSPASNYLGYGGLYSVPSAAYQALGVWDSTMNLTAGERTAFDVHCNMHGCGKWNSAYNLFLLDNIEGGSDSIQYNPATNALSFFLKGTPYSMTPQAFTAGTINATTLNGSLNAANVNSGTLPASVLPIFGASGSSHSPGAVPDPGATAGSTRYLREDGTWDTPAGGGGGSGGATGVASITGGTIDGTAIGGTTPASINATTLNGLPVSEYTNTPRKPLASLLEALHNSTNQAVNIVILGDSFGICDQTNCNTGPTVSTNRYTEQLRINLQGQFGSHGTGMVPLAATVDPRINNEEWAVAGTWSAVNTLGPSQAASFPGASLIHLANGAVATFTSSIPYDTINAYCMTNSNSGSLTVAIDGVTVGTACNTTTTNPTAHAVISSSVALGTHVTTFTSTGDSYLYAAEGTAGATGVSVHNLSAGSAAAEWFGLNPGTQEAFSDLIPTGTQGVITMLQTNEPGVGYDVSSFSTAMSSIISHEQSLPGSPSVLMVVPPVDIINGTAPYTAAQLAIAQQQNVAFVNAQDRWGTTYIPASGLWDLGTGAPGIHPNDKGARDLYSMVYAALVDPVPFSSGGTSGSGCASNCTFTGTTTISGTSASAPIANFTSNFREVMNLASTDTQGTMLLLDSSGASGGDKWGLHSMAAAAGVNAAHSFALGDFSTGIYSWRQQVASDGSGQIAVPALMVNCWAGNATVVTSTCDTGISRTAAGALAIGNGAQGDATGSLALSGLALSATSASGTVANVNSNFREVMKLSSTDAQGTMLLLDSTGASGGDKWALHSMATGAGLNAAHSFAIGDFSTGIYSWRQQVASDGSGQIAVPSLMVNCWVGSTSVVTSACDTGISRTAAGALALGNGTQGDVSGSLALHSAAAAVYKGPATAPTGSCSEIGWAFSQDGHISFCDGTTWSQKM